MTTLEYRALDPIKKAQLLAKRQGYWKSLSSDRKFQTQKRITELNHQLRAQTFKAYGNHGKCPHEKFNFKVLACV